MKKAISRLFRSGQPLLPYTDFVAEINRISLEALSAGGLRDRAERLRQKESWEEEDWLEAMALGKEVIRRQLGYRLFDTQLAASVSLLKGRIAELPTGEGKTLAAVLAASAAALSGRQVHVLVFNDYLAKRDCATALPVFEFLGLSAGCITQSTPAESRKEIYGDSAVYISAKEAGFDFLRNFLCTKKEDYLRIPQDFAIVDEADSILIDEAKIPLVLAGIAPEEPFSASSVARAAETLRDCDVVVNRPANQVYLTDEGIARMESALRIRNLYEPENINLLSTVNAALQARYLLTRDRDYLVKGDAVCIIDECTGRVSENRRYPDLLHSAVEAKERLSPGQGSTIYNTITFQDFLLRYRSLSGMTGTAGTSVNELWNLYGIEVDGIPPHRPCIRTDHEDRIFDTDGEKMRAVAEEIGKAHAKGQPVLVGTQSVAESERLSALLKKKGIPHWVLNAKNDDAEALLIAKAGEPYRVTVSTNMAGRGVDIKLGGEDGRFRREVLESGGLYVIGTGINRSIRIDNQLRGRAGRQGDPGKSRFFISLEEPLLRQFGSELPGGGSHGGKLSKAIRKAQKYAEGEDAEACYMLGRYSYIQEEQRKVITRLRDGILLGEKRPSLFSEREPEYFRSLTASVGACGVEKAEKQLALYFINLRWAQYLESMEAVRDGIHLMLIGGKSPIDEYHRIAISAFDEMLEDIRTDIVTAMKRCRITCDGIDMEAYGFGGATTTWTYLIDESKNQFSRMPYLMKNVSNRIKGTVFTVQDVIHRLTKKAGQP